MTVSAVLAKWLDAEANRVAPNTLDRYRVAIKLHIEPALRPMRVSLLRPHHIEDLYNAVLAEGFSGASIRKIH
ncbi:MAG TPA: N-terminal phage integrase SAM-like domain-containing protein [Acidimicrobiales bacterium]|nr:N-terminal phage integrase SAM-like domain-containing protein [Acidimicrobiales bacterium]